MKRKDVRRARAFRRTVLCKFSCLVSLRHRVVARLAFNMPILSVQLPDLANRFRLEACRTLTEVEVPRQENDLLRNAAKPNGTRLHVFQPAIHDRTPVHDVERPKNMA